MYLASGGCCAVPQEVRSRHEAHQLCNNDLLSTISFGLHIKQNDIQNVRSFAGFPFFISFKSVILFFIFLTLQIVKPINEGPPTVADRAVNIKAFYYKNYKLPENCSVFNHSKSRSSFACHCERTYLLISHSLGQLRK